MCGGPHFNKLITGSRGETEVAMMSATSATTHKRCCTCRRQCSLSRFSRDRNSPDGHGRRCKDCIAEDYQRNIVQRRQSSKDRYRANREAELERLRQWRAEHPDRNREIVRRSRAGIRARRRAAGLCTECGAELKLGDLYCPRCRERDAQRKLSKRLGALL